MAGNPRPPADQPSQVVRPYLWVLFSLLTVLLWGLWGFVSKVVSDDIGADANQVCFTLGLLPLVMLVWRSPRLAVASNRKAGMSWAFVTGLLGGAGNIAFFQSLVVGGRASTVIPITALYPLVTVTLALLFLRERLGNLQLTGLALALVAMYILSLPS